MAVMIICKTEEAEYGIFSKGIYPDATRFRQLRKNLSLFFHGTLIKTQNVVLFEILF